MGKFIDTRAGMLPLPANADVLTNERVWMESAALEQLARVASFDGCVRAVGMPDLHPGPTVPIGVALGFEDRVYPQLIGGDAGCGVKVIAFAKLKLDGDRLERRIREATDDDALPDIDPVAALHAVWQHGPRGLCELDGVPDSLAELASLDDELPDRLPASAPLPAEFAEFAALYGRALGSVGGGNHFIELARVDRIFGERDATPWGLARNAYAVVAHSGSRGLGRALALRHGQTCLASASERSSYLGELAGTCRFAQANRLILAWRLLDAVGAAKQSRIRGSFDLIHNDVSHEAHGERELWVHRKGCAPAHTDQPTVVLGTRGTASYVMRGHGHQACLCSVAHGAGRRMTRSEARAKVAHKSGREGNGSSGEARPSNKYARKTLTRTACGSRVVCDDKQLLYEEHPDAYKDIESVVECLENVGAATRVAALLPIVTVKR